MQRNLSEVYVVEGFLLSHFEAYYNLVNGIDMYQIACFPLFVSNLDLHFHALMSVNNKYYALQYIWSILCCQK